MTLSFSRSKPFEIMSSAEQPTPQGPRGDGNRGKGRGRGGPRGGNRSRGGDGAGRGGAGGGRGKGRAGGGGQQQQQQQQDTPKPSQDVSSGDSNWKTQQPEAQDDDAEVCFICANPITHHSVAPCGHSTCHICALRLRALYKNKDCPHCRVSIAVPET